MPYVLCLHLSLISFPEKYSTMILQLMASCVHFVCILETNSFDIKNFDSNSCHILYLNLNWCLYVGIFPEWRQTQADHTDLSGLHQCHWLGTRVWTEGGKQVYKYSLTWYMLKLLWKQHYVILFYIVYFFSSEFSVCFANYRLVSNIRRVL